MWFTDWIFALTTGISNDGGRLHIASSPVCVLAFMFSIHITADAAPAYQFPTPFSYWWTRCKSTWIPPLDAPAHSPLAKLNITISWSQQNHITRSREPPSAHSLCWEICGKRLSCFSPTTTTKRSDQAPTVVAWGWVVCNNVPNTPYSAN